LPIQNKDSSPTKDSKQKAASKQEPQSVPLKQEILAKNDQVTTDASSNEARIKVGIRI